jgi:uncharacterized protein YidB (DUF937 family)
MYTSPLLAPIVQTERQNHGGTMGMQDSLDKLGGQQGMEGGIATIQKLFGANRMQDVMSKLSKKGMNQQVQSWVSTEPNQPISGGDLRPVMDPAMLNQVAKQHGMSPQEVCDLVAKALPEMVNQATPDGKMPSEDPFSKSMSGTKKKMKV